MRNSYLCFSRSIHTRHEYSIASRLLDGEGDCELIRAIARTVSKTFWVPFYEPRAFDRYDTLWEIAKDLRLLRSASCKSSQNSMMVYFSPNVQLMIHSSPSLHTCLGVEEGSSSVAGSVAASWACEKEEEEEEAEEVPLHKLVEEEGAELTDDETRIKKHQENDSAGCGGGRELGGGRSSTGGGDGNGDSDGGINDLSSLWANISLTVRLGSIYSTPGMFWN